MSPSFADKPSSRLGSDAVWLDVLKRFGFDESSGLVAAAVSVSSKHPDVLKLHAEDISGKVHEGEVEVNQEWVTRFISWLGLDMATCCSATLLIQANEFVTVKQEATVLINGAKQARLNALLNDLTHEANHQS
jgi:hypothetical protein